MEPSSRAPRATNAGRGSGHRGRYLLVDRLAAFLHRASVTLTHRIPDPTPRAGAAPGNVSPDAPQVMRLNEFFKQFYESHRERNRKEDLGTLTATALVQRHPSIFVLEPRWVAQLAGACLKNMCPVSFLFFKDTMRACCSSRCNIPCCAS